MRTICCVETSGSDYPLTQRHIPENWIPQFLGEFAKLRKATISSVMSVGPSVLMEQLGSQWTDFHGN